MEEIIEKLKKIFNINHACFTVEGTEDELQCVFKAGKKSKYRFDVDVPVRLIKYFEQTFS